MVIAAGWGLSCSDHGTTPDCRSTLTDFPNAAGTEWIYATYDSVSGLNDTLRVTVLGAVALPNGLTATAWEYSSSSVIDTHYVRVSGDTVRIQPDPESTWKTTTYVFPLTEGSSWGGAFASDTSWVVEQGSISVPAGTFEQASHIHERWGALNDYGTVDSWLAPGVGLVWQHRIEFGMVLSLNTVATLVDYELASEKP